MPLPPCATPPCRCDCCGRFAPAFHTYYLADGREVCSICWHDDRRVFECHHCGDHDLVRDEGGHEEQRSRRARPLFGPLRPIRRDLIDQWLQSGQDYRATRERQGAQALLEGERYETIVTVAYRWCEPCDELYVGCDDCHERLHTDDTIHIGRGHEVCESCQDDYFVCDDCGDYVYCDNVRYDEYDGTYCGGCYREAGSWAGECSVRCGQCGTHNEHLNLDTETYLCDCAATAAEARGVPVQRKGGTVPLALGLTHTVQVAA